MQSPTTIIEFRYGLLRQRANTDPKSLGFDQTSLGLPQVYLTSGVKMFPTFSPEGYQELGQVGYGLIARGDEMNDVTGSMTKIIGGHNLKAGAEARLMLLNYLQPGYPQGHITFGRAITMMDPNSSQLAAGQWHRVYAAWLGHAAATITWIRLRLLRPNTWASICRTTGSSRAS